jgi:hypothetical protein
MSKVDGRGVLIHEGRQGHSLSWESVPEVRSRIVAMHLDDGVPVEFVRRLFRISRAQVFIDLQRHRKRKELDDRDALEFATDLEAA